MYVIKGGGGKKDEIVYQVISETGVVVYVQYIHQRERKTTTKKTAVTYLRQLCVPKGPRWETSKIIFGMLSYLIGCINGDETSVISTWGVCIISRGQKRPRTE